MGPAHRARSIGRSICRCLLLGTILAAPASAKDDEAQSLARYVPADGLAILVEHDGLGAPSEAWKGTAAYKMLNETSLGVMLEDISNQLVDAGLRNMAEPQEGVRGSDLVALLEHVVRNGFAAGLLVNPRPPQPRAVVVVLRRVANNEAFKRVLGSIPELNPPAAQQVEQPGRRKVWVSSDRPIRWWYENEDFVFCLATDKAADPIGDVLDGRTSSALRHPVRAALMKPEPGRVPVGMFFVDLARMVDAAVIPAPDPRAVELGLLDIKRIDARWGIQGKGLVHTLAAAVPRPRRGIPALFDQPPIGTSARVAVPTGVTDFTLLSVDPVRFGDAVFALVEQSSPESAASITQFVERFQDRTGLRLRSDLLAKLGPRMAILGLPGGAGGGAVGMWIRPPEFGLVAEVKDPQSFLGTLERLMAAANRELKAAGALVPPQSGEPSRPGTEFAEFRRLKAPERGYVLSVPPSVLPTPAGLRPTVQVDVRRGSVAIATSPAAARRLLPSLVLRGAGAERDLGRDTVVLQQFDPSGTLPELLANIPSLVQLIGFAVSQPQPGAPAGPGMARTRFRLQLDPDAIPDVDTMRVHLFPSTLTLAVDDASIRLSSYQAFPLPVPQLNLGMEVPILIALLLPAVQSAREAARRAQCVNNLKQIGLAMHNYASAYDGFPAAAIVDKGGKPLLSWRVAILPFLELKSLHDKFKLDEPWDSPHNRRLLKEMPPVYGCPSRNLAGEPGMTAYRVFSGRGALLDATGRTPLAAVTDGLSNTFLVVESTEAVPWTKPDELRVDDGAPLRDVHPLGAGSRHPGGFNALFGDASVRFLKSSIDLATFRALITKSGGEVISREP